MNQPVWKIADEIIGAWDIKSWIADPDILADIESAIEEAYFKGAYNASKDKDILNEATEYVEDIRELEKRLTKNEAQKRKAKRMLSK